MAERGYERGNGHERGQGRGNGNERGRGRGRGMGGSRDPQQSTRRPYEGHSSGHHSRQGGEFEEYQSKRPRYEGASTSRGGGYRGRGGYGGQGRGTGRPDDRGPPSSVPTSQEDRPVKLVTNYFKITTPNLVFHQYHVDFEPEIESTRMKRALVQVHREQLGAFIFDGMVLYSTQRFDDDMELTSLRRSDDVNITITLRNTGEIAPYDSKIIQALNILMRRAYRTLKFHQLNRNYFDPHEAVVATGTNFEIWPGFLTAIHRYESDVLLQAASLFKILRTDSVLIQLANYRDRRDEAIRDLVGCVVMTRYNNRTYKIEDIEWDLSPRSTFQTKKGTELSYVDYYKEHWNLIVGDVNQPLLLTKRPSRRSEQQQVEQNPILLIPEFTCMTGISEATRNDRHTMQNIAQYTRLKPDVRVEKLKKFMDRLHSNDDVITDMKKWAVEFDRNALEVQGTTIGRLNIVQQEGPYDYANDCANWANSMREKKLYNVMALRKWVLIYPSILGEMASELIRNLKRVCPGMGISVNDPITLPLQDASPMNYSKEIKSCYNDKLELVVCLVPDNRKDRYDVIKKVCCIDLPVPSQIVVRKSLDRPTGVLSVVTKIGIQINCKLGGAPWTVPNPIKGLMVVGYDSYLDSSRGRRVVGALCCSLDQSLTKYFSKVKYQDSDGDVVNGLIENLTAALYKYHEKNNKCYPSGIVFYRNGISEGQIRSIKETEVNGILNVLKQLGIPEIRFLFIGVSKRINSRLIAKVDQRLLNPAPGTVVDKVITRPNRNEFYLVSQHVNQGTVMPTHYEVLHETVLKKPLERATIQKITYKLTHLYYNWAGTIQVPAPCKYAYKLAFLTSQSLHAEPNPRLSDKLFFL